MFSCDINKFTPKLSETMIWTFSIQQEWFCIGSLCYFFLLSFYFFLFALWSCLTHGNVKYLKRLVFLCQTSTWKKWTTAYIYFRRLHNTFKKTTYETGSNYKFKETKIATKTTLPFHNKQWNNRENLFKTVEIKSVNNSALCPRAVFSTIRERERKKNMYI